MNGPQAAKPVHPSQPQPPNGDVEQSIEDVPMFKKKRVLIPLILAFGGVIIGGWYWYVSNYSFVGTDDAYIDANRLTVSAKIMGRVARLSVDEGDTARQGDTIVKLDDTDLLAQLAKAEASVRFLTRSAEISSVNLDKARDDFSRAEKQFKGQIITQEQYDHSQNAFKLAEAQADMAQSQIATAQADLNIIKTQISNTVIAVPFSGVIAKRWVMQGDVVQPGQAIFSMYDVKNVWVTANYEETKLRAIRPGMRAEIAIDAFPGKALQGKILMIGKTTASQFSLIPASNASGNFTKVTQRVPVKISIDAASSGFALVPGLSVTVHVIVR